VNIKDMENKRLILVAEDDPTISDMLKHMLSPLGCNCLVETNGKQALQSYAKNWESFSAVITDMGMPIMDGYELIPKLIEINPEVRIIVSSGFGEKITIQNLPGKENIVGMLNKPYHFETLKKLVQEIILVLP
jgi:CheY-like chemotaxis protein